MKKTTIKLMFALPVIATILAFGPSASAQTQGRWSNAKNSQFYLSVSGGGQCGVNHGSCWFNNGQQMILWNTLSNDQLFWAYDGGTGPVWSVGYLDPSWSQHMCIGVSGGSTTAGAGLVVWQCDNSLNQTWTMDDPSQYGLNAPGCYVFRNNNDNQVMAVAAGSMTNGAHVVQWPATNATLDMAWCPR